MMRDPITGSWDLCSRKFFWTIQFCQTLSILGLRRLNYNNKLMINKIMNSKINMRIATSATLSAKNPLRNTKNGPKKLRKATTFKEITWRNFRIFDLNQISTHESNLTIALFNSYRDDYLIFNNNLSNIRSVFIFIIFTRRL